jgi:hypothetical protein
MKRIVMLFLLLVQVVVIYPERRPQVVYPTIPGTDLRDYTQPGLVIDRRGTAYPTVPGTQDIPDYTQPGIKVDEGRYGR